MNKKKQQGATPFYKTPAGMQRAIEKYFLKCAGEMKKDEDGNPGYTEKGFPVWIYPPCPPTVTGLALALGFTSRQALLNYQAKEDFVDTVTRAKSRIEEYAEQRLFDKDGATGAKFSLINNFKGWTAEQNQQINLNPLAGLTDDELKELLNKA